MVLPPASPGALPAAADAPGPVPGAAAPASAGPFARPDGGTPRHWTDLMVPVPMSELFTIAARQEHHGNLQEADRLLNHILAVAPNQPDALHMSGIVAFRLGRHEEALAKMEQAIAHGVDIALYLRNICGIRPARRGDGTERSTVVA
jgi:tetratricopeptide (TPR) repeat protein